MSTSAPSAALATNIGTILAVSDALASARANPNRDSYPSDTGHGVRSGCDFRGLIMAAQTAADGMAI